MQRARHDLNGGAEAAPGRDSPGPSGSAAPTSQKVKLFAALAVLAVAAVLIASQSGLFTPRAKTGPDMPIAERDPSTVPQSPDAPPPVSSFTRQAQPFKPN